MGGIELGTVWLILMAVLWLVFLEGLLSADNALVLAMMVRHLPRPQQKRALRYGIWGAFLFRLVAVSLASLLLQVWPLKVLGGLYLLYLAGSHFLLSSRGEEHGVMKRPFGGGFWGTVLSVELADIAFSIDSILAAVAAADKLPIGPTGRYWVVVVGGFLGILTMRFVAGYFIILLDKFRGLEQGAYGLVAWIGLNLVTGGLHDGEWIRFEMNQWVFWIGMLAIVVMGLLYKPSTPPTPQDTMELAQEFSRGMGGSPDDEVERPGERNPGGAAPGAESNGAGHPVGPSPDDASHLPPPPEIPARPGPG
jgi:YkoY family integral membrane protein